MINLGKIKTLADFIKEVAHTYGGKTALKFRPKFRSVSFTYEDIYELSKTYGQILKNGGIKKGDRVIIWAPNSPYWVAAFFGIQLVGAVAVPLNVQSRGDFIEKIIKATETKFILKSQILPSFGDLNLAFFDLETIKPQKDLGLFSPAIDGNDLAEIVYTSGTTGFPKGVMLTHKNILSDLAGVFSVIQLTEKDRGLSILPLSHSFEQIGGMLVPLAAGAQVTYATALNSISISKNLVEDKITKMAAVPEFLKLTIRRLEETAKEKGKKKVLDLCFKLSQGTASMRIRRILFHFVLKRFGSHLNTIFSGGAALDEEVGKKWEALGIYILQGYGTTEASPVISANTYSDRKITSVGRPLPQVEVRISKDGEILARGENIFPGYWRDEEKTREVFEDSWYKTGDLGFIDRDSHLHIKGRKKYMIVTEAGVNVYPEDLEFELNKLPGVEDSCVVGLKVGDRLLIHAVLLGKNFDPEGVVGLANKKLESYQQIQEYSAWPFDDFPRTVTKKVKRDEVIKYLETRKVEDDEFLVSSAKVGVVEKCLVKITNLPLGKITPKMKLVGDLKMDSLERVELVAAIEEETGIILDEAEIGPTTTVFDIVKKVEKKLQKVERHEFKEWPLSAPILILRKIAQKLLVVPLSRYFMKIETEGVENLKSLAKCSLFYCNHLSGIDPAAVVIALPEKIRQKLAIAAAADVVFEDPKYKKWEGFLTLLFNIYPFSRYGQVKSSLEYTGRLLDRGFSILAFPEGAVSETGRMQHLRQGAGFLAVEMGVGVVPVKIEGTPNIVPPGVYLPCWPKKGRVKVKFGTPLHFLPETSYSVATKKIEKVMMNSSSNNG